MIRTEENRKEIVAVRSVLEADQAIKSRYDRVDAGVRIVLEILGTTRYTSPITTLDTILSSQNDDDPWLFSDGTMCVWSKVDPSKIVDYGWYQDMNTENRFYIPRELWVRAKELMFTHRLRNVEHLINVEQNDAFFLDEDGKPITSKRVISDVGLVFSNDAFA